MHDFGNLGFGISGFTSEVLTPELLLHAGLYVSGLVRQGLWLRFQVWRAETRAFDVHLLNTFHVPE